MIIGDVPMKTKLILFLMVLLAVLAVPVNAMTVYYSVYSATMSPGQTNSFTMGLKADVARENGMPISISVGEGNCTPWITTDKQNLVLSYNRTPVTATITVPEGTPAGFYKSYVFYTMAPSGMVTGRIAVPVKITVR
jgi:hypothetical protein